MDRLSDFVARLIAVIQPIAEELGGAGLVLVAFFDSSFLSLPQVNDALVVVLTMRNPSLWFYYAMSSTVGSIAGCFTLYSIGRKGGEAFLRRKFNDRNVDRGLALFSKYGWLAVIVPSLLPPPTPFKLFVLLAGVAGIRPLPFVASVALGRGFRYGAEAWLARQYGSRATEFIRTHLQTASIWLAVAILVLAVGVMLWRRRQAA